jgi:hypothetical protein
MITSEKPTQKKDYMDFLTLLLMNNEKVPKKLINVFCYIFERGHLNTTLLFLQKQINISKPTLLECLNLLERYRIITKKAKCGTKNGTVIEYIKK